MSVSRIVCSIRYDNGAIAIVRLFVARDAIGSVELLDAYMFFELCKTLVIPFICSTSKLNKRGAKALWFTFWKAFSSFNEPL